MMSKRTLSVPPSVRLSVSFRRNIRGAAADKKLEGFLESTGLREGSVSRENEEQKKLRLSVRPSVRSSVISRIAISPSPASPPPLTPPVTLPPLKETRKNNRICLFTDFAVKHTRREKKRKRKRPLAFHCFYTKQKDSTIDDPLSRPRALELPARNARVLQANISSTLRRDHPK